MSTFQVQGFQSPLFSFHNWIAIWLKKNLALMVCLLMSAGTLDAQTTWTGASSTNWATAANWTAGVPDTDDDVTIPDVANDPVILANTGAEAKSVTINSGATLTINASASLTLNGAGAGTNALTNDGTVNNNGTISIGATGSSGDFGLLNSFVFNNNAGAVLQVDNTSAGGIQVLPAGAIANAGTITIGATASVGENGITNSGIFTNQTGAVLNIDRSTLSGLNNSSTFNNSGALIIGAVAEVGQFGIYSSNTFNNNTGGEIKIDRAFSSALRNIATFTNAAKITIGAVSYNANTGLRNNGAFNNVSGGDIRIDNTTSAALMNEAVSSTFNNAARITIGAVANVGQYGIDNSGMFNNNTGGEIYVDRSNAAGVWCYSNATFNNSAKLYIGATANVDGIGILSYSTFNNNSTGEIRVDRFISNGISTISSFTNTGKISIGAVSTGSYSINNTNTFSNQSCAELFLYAPLNNSGAITNNGYCQINTTQTHINTGTVVNNGILEYPMGNPIPAVTNNDLLASPISMCGGSFTPALAIGGANSFTAAATWYSNQSLTIPAGTYNQANNTFTWTNTPVPGAYVLYFAVTDNVNACTRTVSVTVTMVTPPIANAGPDQTGSGTCGLTTVTLAANTPTVGTGAWSIVAGTGGSFGDASSPTSTFNGTAGITYTLRWTVSNPPCAASTDDVTITFNRNPTTANAGPDQTDAATCGLTTVTLSANTPTVGTGAWSIVAGTGGSFGNASSPTSTFNGTAGNTYTLRWTISNAPCAASTDDVTITFNRNPTTANAGSDQTGAATCGLTTVTLAANTPTVGTGTWSIVTGTGGSFGNANSPTSTFSGTAGSTYTLRWTISNVLCTASTDDVTITFNRNPTTADAGPDQTSVATCGLTTVTLTANTPTVGTGAWSIVAGTGGSFGNASSPTSTFSGTAGNTYTLRWTISNAPCVASTDDMTVTLNQTPTVSCPNDLTVDCSTPAFALTGGSPTGGTYSGTGVSGGMFNPATSGDGTHTISYTYLNASGCLGSCTFTIVVNSSASCSSGKLWGMTSDGGEFDAGTIINLNTDGSDFNTFSFYKVEGGSPRGDLLKASNGKFYGMASDRGKNGDGVIFEYDPVADTYVALHHFSYSTSGSTPYGNLTELSGKFYGMASQGGSSNGGVLFEFDPAANVFAVLRHFNSATDGVTPRGSLIASGGKLYGMNSNGGNYNDGTLFEFNPAGNVFTVLKHFDGTTDGLTPFGSLVESGGKFYGMTTNGGSNGEGVLFEFNPAGNVLTVLKHFDRPTDGAHPQGSLIVSGGKFYGMTLSGGSNDNGVLFEFNPAGNVYTVLKHFESTSDGGFPNGGLLASGGKLVGMTRFGGNTDNGTLFELNLAGNAFTVLRHFNEADGANPYGTLIESGGKFYGMTNDGGSEGEGTLFEFNPAGNVFTVLKHFEASPDGGGPKGSLLASGGKFYGMTSGGGDNDDGVLFEFNPAGNVLTVLKHLNASTDGRSPDGSPIESGGKFYGMTTLGGSNDYGTLFEFNPVGNVFTVLRHFNEPDGIYPNGSLIESGGKLYGMTNQGGSNFGGTLFEHSPANNAFTVLKHFGGTDGATPYGDLLASGGKLYGVTTFGGNNGYGVLFEYNPAGNVYTVLKHFDTPGGTYPAGSLIELGGKFYAMTNSGGSNNSGTLFEFNPAGNVYTVLKHFDNSVDGGNPNGSLVVSGGRFYGMTTDGGSNDDGTVFEFNPAGNVYTVLRHFNGADGAEPYGNLIAASAPEINVAGNNMNIADGDDTPSTADHTDFGNVVVNGSFARTFTIENTGTVALNISSITSSNPKFTVGTAPAWVAPLSSATFEVSFLPMATGVQNATITVENDDPDEGVYDFAVTGAGVCPGAGWVTCPENIAVDVSDPAFALTGGSPMGGTYSGPGVSSGMFNPANAGAGTHTITYSYADGLGCSDECMFTITVNNGSSIQISGTLIWEHDDATGVGNATVALTGDGSGSMTTIADGTYSFTVTSGSSFTITPTKNINKLNGVTTADATRIQQHVANISPITDPYKLVAADVNKSNSVTTQDASIINQALLGNPAALAQFKTSWRFVPTSHTMTTPPWGFPEKITLTGVNGSVPDQDFFGIKTGDVIMPSTDPENFNNPDVPAFVLHAPDQPLQFGEQVTITFTANQFSDLAALQFALKFDVEKLALVKIEPLGGLPVSMENFGTYNISEGEINVVWSQADGVFVEEAAPVFKLTFNVLETGGVLSDALQLAEEALPGHAYTSTLADNSVKLNFFGITSASDLAAQPQIELLQNRPNPFERQTTIGFVLPEGCGAQLRVYDAAGRVLAEKKAQYAAGRHEEMFNLEGASGVLWYELVTPFGVLAKKMVRAGE